MARLLPIWPPVVVIAAEGPGWRAAGQWRMGLRSALGWVWLAR